MIFVMQTWFGVPRAIKSLTIKATRLKEADNDASANSSKSTYGLM